VGGKKLKGSYSVACLGRKRKEGQEGGVAMLGFEEGGKKGKGK